MGEEEDETGGLLKSRAPGVAEKVFKSKSQSQMLGLGGGVKSKDIHKDAGSSLHMKLTVDAKLMVNILLVYKLTGTSSTYEHDFVVMYTIMHEDLGSSFQKASARNSANRSSHKKDRLYRIVRKPYQQVAWELNEIQDVMEKDPVLSQMEVTEKVFKSKSRSQVLGLRGGVRTKDIHEVARSSFQVLALFHYLVIGCEIILLEKLKITTEFSNGLIQRRKERRKWRRKNYSRKKLELVTALATDRLLKRFSSQNLKVKFLALGEEKGQKM
ncbi:hypothetical protein Cgig2_004330 [Carnegiea gigantea]|uniref:Uncharacterized protein n=1 Tax=Carnegiea gigantea TaxID=171969 RepID=A0A9Q1Q8T6_9CARY|nr:hypothetical protein Cgig2_004330 [Carnegiea gigantea]